MSRCQEEDQVSINLPEQLQNLPASSSQANEENISELFFFFYRVAHAYSVILV